MKLNVTEKQMKKFHKGQPFQINHRQISGDDEDCNCEIDLPEEYYKKISKAHMHGKGVRISGGDIFGKINSSFKKAGKDITKIANKSGDAIKKASYQTGDAIVKSANDIDHWAKKEDIGGYVEDIKGVIPQAALTTVLSMALIAGATASGQLYLIPMAAGLASASTAALYKADFSKDLNTQGEAVAKATVISGVRSGVTSGVKSASASQKAASKGEGFSLSKLKKGISKGGSELTKGVSRAVDDSKQPIQSARKAASSRVNDAQKEFQLLSRDIRNESEAAYHDVENYADSTLDKSKKVIKKMKMPKVSVDMSGGSFKPIGKGFQPVGGKGFQPVGGSLKGSQEMKDKMARLRAMRRSV